MSHFNRPDPAGSEWENIVDAAVNQQTAKKRKKQRKASIARSATRKQPRVVGCAIAACLLIGCVVFAANRIISKPRPAKEQAKAPAVEVADENIVPRKAPAKDQPANQPKNVAPKKIAPPKAVPKIQEPNAPQKEFEAKRALKKNVDKPNAAAIQPKGAQANEVPQAAARDWIGKVECSVPIILRKRGGSGSAFLVGPNLLATNSHVIDGELSANLRARFLKIDDPAGEEVPVRVVHDDPSRDLALLELLAPIKKRFILKLAADDQLKVGLEVSVIGHPGNAHDGTISILTRTKGYLVETILIEGESHYRLSAPAGPGNSGGPVLDATTGDCIGVLTRARRDSLESCCIPVTFLQAAIRDLGEGEHREQYASEAAARHDFAFGYRFLCKEAREGKKIIDLRDDLEYREKSKGPHQKSPTLTVDGRKMNLSEFSKFIAEKYKERMGPYRPEIIKAMDDPLVPYAMRDRLKEMATINRDIWKLVEFRKTRIESIGTPHQMMERFYKLAEKMRQELQLPELPPSKSP